MPWAHPSTINSDPKTGIVINGREWAHDPKRPIVFHMIVIIITISQPTANANAKNEDDYQF